MSRRNWCFTWNNPDTERPKWEPQHMRYLIYQLEVGDNGTQHWQGYVELTRKCRLGRVKLLLGNNTIHVEPRRGTRIEARDYCKKDDTRVDGPYEHGEWVGDGERTDLAKLFDGVRAGKSDLTLFEEQPEGYARHYRAIHHIRSLYAAEAAKNWREIKTIVYYGDTGEGKTRRVFEDTPAEDLFVKESTLDKFWDGYTGQKVLLLDDFYGQIPYSDLLRILDGYKLQRNVKNSVTWAAWTTVYITSNSHPRDWYRFGLTPALKRRLTECYHFCNGTEELVELE